MRRALTILAVLLFTAPFCAQAGPAQPEEGAVIPAQETCVDRTEAADALWASLTAPDGYAFAAPGVWTSGCSGNTPCQTVQDCPCPDSRCACVQSPSCGKLCLCRTECFGGGDPP